MRALRRAARRGRRPALSVGLVVVLAGWLFAWNAGASQDSDLRDAPGLRGLVTARDRQVEDLQARRAELAAEVEALLGAGGPAAVEADSALAGAAGATPVKGPGLTVTLGDAEAPDEVLTGTVAPRADLLVHQQDIDAVINALWAGGAEAVAVQGHRIGSVTPVKCVGNVILVGGRVYSPPYQIAAIGPAADLRRQLDNAPVVRAYRERAGRLGLTWGTVDSDELTLPGDTAASSALRYAKALD
jgi:uncharacterized protein YlxW (UPF0749 family)